MRGGARGSAASTRSAQRLQPLQQQPGVERRDAGPVLRMKGCSVSSIHFLRPEHRAAEHAALAVDMLGAGIDDHIRAELQRLLQQRGREHVVHHHDRAGCVREFGDRRADRPFPASGWTGVSSSTSCVGRGQRRRATGRDRRRPRTRFSMPKRGSRVETIQWQEPNSAREATTRSPAFRCASSAACTAAMPVAVARQASAPSISGQPLLQHGDGRVAEAGILVMLDRAGEGGLGLLGAVVDEAGGEEERLGGFAELAALGAAMHESGRGRDGGGLESVMLSGPSLAMGPTGGAAWRAFGARRWPL